MFTGPVWYKKNSAGRSTWEFNYMQRSTILCIAISGVIDINFLIRSFTIGVYWGESQGNTYLKSASATPEMSENPENSFHEKTIFICQEKLPLNLKTIVNMKYMTFHKNRIIRNYGKNLPVSAFYLSGSLPFLAKFFIESAMMWGGWPALICSWNLTWGSWPHRGRCNAWINQQPKWSKNPLTPRSL